MPYSYTHIYTILCTYLIAVRLLKFVLSTVGLYDIVSVMFCPAKENRLCSCVWFTAFVVESDDFSFNWKFFVLYHCCGFILCVLLQNCWCVWFLLLVRLIFVLRERESASVCVCACMLMFMSQSVCIYSLISNIKQNVCCV